MKIERTEFKHRGRVLEKSLAISPLLLTFWLSGAMLFPLWFPADALSAEKVPRLGFLSAAPSIDPAFLDALRDHGYIDKKTILIEQRSARGNLDRLPALAAELARIRVDIIVTQGTPAAQAAKKATSTIPIVMATSGDAVGAGLVASLARPAGNVTGLSFLGTDVGTKRLELLKETLPNASRIAFLSNPAIVPEAITFKNLQSVAPSLGLNIELIEVRSPDEFEGAFAAAVRERCDAALLSANSSYIDYASKLVLLEARQRLPVMYSWEDFPEAGGFMSYGVSIADLFRRAATFVDKVLKGARPADLPVEQPTKFDLVVNLQTAKKLGVAVPANVLAQADKVIR
jgi:putative tryptophan/tyrosine transport system substrate-binding protein